jgi:hypothetical protein
MGETVIETEELKNKLQKSGLNSILNIYLMKDILLPWRVPGKNINDHESIINLGIAIDPIPVNKWYLQVGRFINNTKGYDEEPDKRAGDLRKLFGNDNILSYFMVKEPDFRLRDSDNLKIVRSMLVAISDIEGAGITIEKIAFRDFDYSRIEKAREITHNVTYEPYFMGDR